MSGNADIALIDGAQFESMTSAELCGFIEQHHWIYAKTMPKCPHEYVVRQHLNDDRAFFRFAMTIRRFGVDEPFYSKVHRYLDVAGHKYWTMGYWLYTTTIINRARISHQSRPMVVNPKQFIPMAWPHGSTYNPPAGWLDKR